MAGVGMCFLTSAHAITPAPAITSAVPPAIAIADPAEPIRITTQTSLALSRTTAAQLLPVQKSWQPLSPLRLESSPSTHESAAPGNDSMREWISTGDLSWLVTPDGTRLRDHATGQQFYTTALTSSNVRPSDIVYSQRLGAVWFYGDALYRYRIDSHALERLQPATTTIETIRKAVLSPSGLWLAAGNGIFVLDEAGTALQKITYGQLGRSSVVNAVAAGNDIWFATAEPRLIRIAPQASGQLGVAASTTPLPGPVAEMVVAKNSLWLLMSNRHGDSYKLAYIETGNDRLNVLDGKYYSLRSEEGHLLARNYSTLFEIDPVAKTITRYNPDEAHLLARSKRDSAILFLGSSYVYKDGCEIVEHGRFDLSKGWSGTHVSIRNILLQASIP
jgi:hypothetical protein